MEMIQENMGPSQGQGVTPDASRLTAFEPEVLAFCCEH